MSAAARAGAGTGARSLVELPKAHLHLHLDGSLRRSTVEEIAAAEGREVPWPSGYGSFAHFMETITAAAACLRDEEDVRRAVREIVEDAGAAGAVWLELSVWPGLFQGRLGDYASAVAVVLEAGREAAERSGVGFGLIAAANRGLGADDALAVAEVAAECAGRDVVGFGLDGDEAAAPAAWFGRPFDIAREAGLLSVPHAGEIAGPESVRAALDVLGADRVLHGVRAIDDPALVGELAARGTALDVCLTSNALLGVYDPVAANPLPALLDAGVRCSLNADDSLLFDTHLVREYELARSVLGLSDERLAALAAVSIESSAAPAALKTTALGRIDAWLRAPHPEGPCGTASAT
ncbi:adenosine deaminase [Streptomyces sp. NPDC048172]|uniref:adenosine deaminase n=1 Tax=Streptomyces sp. NPDC048172 TaxID=3365505 RepID=UPI00371D6BE7